MKLLINIFAVLFLISCSNKKGNMPPSVVITFDDDYIREWYSNLDLFDKYNAKVTFCISNFNKLDSTEIRMLHYIKSRGHAIANHSLSHTNPLTYIENNGIKEYLRREVDSSFAILKKSGFTTNCYAIPFGEGSSELTDSLLTRYNLVRGAIDNPLRWYMQNRRTLDVFDDIYIFTPIQRYTESMGIDINYRNTISLIKPGLKRCKSDSLCIVLYAHRINESDSNYSVSNKFLDSLLKEINALNLQYKTLH